MPPYGEQASGRAVCPFRRGVTSSESESIFSLEGRLATLERVSAGGPRARRRLPRGFEGVRMGRTVYLGRGLGFFESFPFLWIGRRLLALVGPFA